MLRAGTGEGQISLRLPPGAVDRASREIAQSRVRYGYRMIRVLLNREGLKVGKDLVYRLYTEEGLGLRKRPSGRR